MGIQTGALPGFRPGLPGLGVVGATSGPPALTDDLKGTSPDGACPKPEHDKFKVSDTVYAVPNLWNSDVERWEAALRTAKARTRPANGQRSRGYDFPSASY